MAEITPRARAWATTMGGNPQGDFVTAHAGAAPQIATGAPVGRVAREEYEAARLRPGAALARGAGERAVPEEPDAERTCFERDRDRIVHSTAFRRLAGKTQVVVFPTDHQRTRLTHALEVAQVATSIARGVGANVALAEAIALGHDCGHGPGGHAAEDAFDVFLDYDHGPWGADVVLTSLNLCAETLDGVRNHSWSRPGPRTVEGQIVSWADRIAYCAHDLEDAISAGILTLGQVPVEVAQIAGRTRREQLSAFIRAVISTTVSAGQVGMDAETASALAALRAFNYERIYTRAESLAQAAAVIDVLRALTEHYATHPSAMPPQQRGDDKVLAAVKYVAGMTDRYAFDRAVAELGWDRARLPAGVSG
ncbi:MAG: HD domain-containing protein [Propionibacteriaceae bacterium]|jgi:dGTPase|nr:HD domain-containing protein [Propionibacteriaceae bacterium]